MTKNRLFLGSMTTAAMLLFAACPGERQDTTIIEQPVVTEQPTTAPTMTPVPMTPDTMIVRHDTMPGMGMTDTLAPGTPPRQP
jgi:hypothetical protein